VTGVVRLEVTIVAVFLGHRSDRKAGARKTFTGDAVVVVVFAIVVIAAVATVVVVAVVVVVIVVVVVVTGTLDNMDR